VLSQRLSESLVFKSQVISSHQHFIKQFFCVLTNYPEFSYTHKKKLAYIYGDVTHVYSPMKAENTQLQETEWTEDRQTY